MILEILFTFKSTCTTLIIFINYYFDDCQLLELQLTFRCNMNTSDSRLMGVVISSMIHSVEIFRNDKFRHCSIIQANEKLHTLVSVMYCRSGCTHVMTNTGPILTRISQKPQSYRSEIPTNNNVILYLHIFGRYPKSDRDRNREKNRIQQKN